MSVPTRTESLDDLYTSTWNNRKSDVVDQIFDEVPFYNYMRKTGGITLNGTGGRYLEIPLAYAKNDTVTSIGKGDTISLADTAFLTTAQFEWKFVAGTVIRYYVDDAKNKSKQQHLSLIDAKVDNLRRSMSDAFETYLFGDGTGNDSKDPEGLGNLVSTTPTSAATVGNIAQATYTWWQNKQKTSTGAASVYLLSDMRTLYNNCSKGQNSDVPTVIVCDQTSYELYDDEVIEQKQIVNQATGNPMFENGIKFKNCTLIWSGQAPSGRMYFLNEKYIGLNVDPDINFTATEWKSIPNQLDRVMQIVVKCNLITSRRKSLGVLTSVSA